MIFSAGNIKTPGRFILLLALMSGFLQLWISAQSGLRLAVMLPKNAHAVHWRFQPVADYLSKNLGIPVRIIAFENYQQCIQIFKNGSADLAYLGGIAYLKCSKIPGTRLLVQPKGENKDSMHSAYIMTVRDSKIKIFQDLKGKIICCGDPLSTSGTAAPLAVMAAAGFDAGRKSKLIYETDQRQALRRLMMAECSAVCVSQRAFENEDAGGFEILAEIKALPNYVFTATRQLDADMQERITELFLALDERAAAVMPGGSQMAPELKFGFRRVSDSDFDGLRKLIEPVKKEFGL